MMGASSFIKDPRLLELQTLIKILETKLVSNLSSVEDFKYLLIETKKEPFPNKEIQGKLIQIEEGLEEAKSFLLTVQTQKN